MLSILAALAIVSFTPDDVLNAKTAGGIVRNWTGRIGAIGIHYALRVLGWGTIALVAVSFVWALRLLWPNKAARTARTLIGIVTLSLSSAVSLDFIFPEGFGRIQSAGGLLGHHIHPILRDNIGPAGTWTVIICAYLFALVLLVDASLPHLAFSLLKVCSHSLKFSVKGFIGLLDIVGDGIEKGWQRFWDWCRIKRAHIQTLRDLRKRERAARKEERTRTVAAVAEPILPSDNRNKTNAPNARRKRIKPVVQTPLPEPEPADSDETAHVPVIVRADSELGKPRDILSVTQQKELFIAPVLSHTPQGGGELIAYIRPDIIILDEPQQVTDRESEEELLEKSRLLVQKLGDFGIQGQVTSVIPGPVVTCFEYAPAPGVKISKVAGLADDLALALKSKYVPRVAPIPGKAVIGIEVANRSRETVYLRDVLDTEEFQLRKLALPIPLGKDTMGNPVISDLTQMPHLLIAGATGSGKSVCINAILASLLFYSTPHELRLIMIDPKMLELSDFNEIPHLREPVVTDPKKAPEVLQWAVEEMENRYRLLAGMGVRNLKQYNKALETRPPEERPPGFAQVQPMPYLVVVIDELADLMMVSAHAVEDSIVRLVQMARAAGIHLILATQRPSVDVITGLIKANMPCRIAFQVSSKVDSRTIIDGNGAETLLGKGDMLFMPPGTSKLMRLHGAFVSEQEVKRVVKKWREQPRLPDEKSIFAPNDGFATSGSLSGDDELYSEAVKLVVQSKIASISLLQRRLRIGHARAARLIDMMEQDGIVGPHLGSKPREILKDPEDLPELEWEPTS